MSAAVRPALPALSLPLLLRRVLWAIGIATLPGLLLGTFWDPTAWSVIQRVWIIALVALAAYTLFERWPVRLPRWLARWVLQVAMVALSVPPTVLTIYIIGTGAADPPLWADRDRLGGMTLLIVLGILLAPWVALAALVRHKDAIARQQALAFALERSELERQALDARLQRLQAQVAPHFLFNTLANIKALVETAAPQAPVVLDHLIAYLRAAVPQLDAPTATIGRELAMARAYLALMQMRMPDRLVCHFDVEADCEALPCPSMALMTLVENAVRHGIDPSEDGGRIEIEVRRLGDRCVLRVSDTGVGLGRDGAGLGTGLASLRERLQLMFGAAAALRLDDQRPHGVRAELLLPIATTPPA